MLLVLLVLLSSLVLVIGTLNAGGGDSRHLQCCLLSSSSFAVNVAGLVFQSPVATNGKNWQLNWTTTNLDRTVVASPRGRAICSVAVAVA